MKQGANPKVVVLIVVMVAALGYLVLLRPQGATLSEAREDRERVAAELAQLERLDERRAEVPAGALPEEAQLGAAIPAAPELSNLFRQLNTIAAESGMQQTSVTPSALASTEGQAGGSLQLALAVSGPATGAAAYLQRLATLERLFVVEQFSLQRAVGGVDGAVQLQLTGRVFTSQTPAAPLDG